MAFDDDVLVGVCLQARHRIVEQAERLGTERRTVEVEVHVLEVQLDDRRRPDYLNRHRVRRRAPLPIVHDDGRGNGALLHRRRPDGLSIACVCESSGGRRPSIGQRVAVRILRVAGHGGRLADLDRARFAACPDCRWTILRRRKGSLGRLPRRRRRVHAHSRVVPNPDLQVVVVADDVRFVGESARPRPCRDIPAHAAAGKESVLRLKREAERRARHVLRRRRERRAGQIVADDGGSRDRDHILGRNQTVQLARDAQHVARRKRDASAPAKRAGWRVDAVGAATKLVAAESRDLDELRRFLADDEIEGHIRLAGADSRVLVARRQLHDRTRSDGRRVLTVLGPQVELRTQVEITDVVARPVFVDARIAIDDAAEGRVVDEDRTDVAIDARVDEKRSKNLGAILQPVREGACEVGDVGVALDPVRSTAIYAPGPLAVAQHLSGRHVPDSGIAKERRGCRSSWSVGR